MSFVQWLRSNSERYLLSAAQERVAKQNGMSLRVKSRGLKDYFWRYVFVPIYFAMPDRLRRKVFHALPGSHRRVWPKQPDRPRRVHQFSISKS